MGFIKTLLLGIFIAACAVFVYAMIGSRGPDNNYFNTNYRLRLSQYPFLRTVLGLHNNGDGRNDYLGSKYKSIVIEVDAFSDVPVNTSMLDRFAAKVQAITGKPTTYTISETSLIFSNINDADLSSIVTRFRNVSGPNAASIYLLLADTKSGQPQLLGSTYQEYGIVLYYQNLQAFTKTSPSTLDDYAYSTLLHEFGHQIGLDHNDQVNCIMNPKVESNNQPVAFSDEVITDFCPLEEQQIQQLKAQVY